MTFRSILVPLDGSAFAEQALPFALGIARRAEALLQLALVHQPLPVWALSLEMPQIDPAIDLEARDRERGYLDGLATRIRNQSNLPVSAVILDGPVAGSLVEQVAVSAADLVVLTTHGRGPMSRFWLGSIADQLARHLPVPALLVRPGDQPSPPDPVFRHILVPLDGSKFSEAILEPAVALGRLMGSEYTLLRVVEPVLPIVDPSSGLPPLLDPDLNGILRAEAEKYLTSLALGLRREGLRVSTRVIEVPTAGRGILEQSQGTTCDLLALATHGAGGVRRAFLGSVADKLVRGSTHPVLVLRPRTED